MDKDIPDGHRFYLTDEGAQSHLAVHCNVRSQLVLADYSFRVPLQHIEVLLGAFQCLRQESEREFTEQSPAPFTWLACAFALRIMQSHVIHRRRGTYILTEPALAFVHALFANGVCWFIENYREDADTLLPSSDMSFSAYALYESTVFMDNRLRPGSLLDRQMAATSEFVLMDRHYYHAIESHRKRVASEDLAATVSRVIRKAVKGMSIRVLDNDSLAIKYHRLKRFMDVARLPPPMTNENLLEPAKIAV